MTQIGTCGGADLAGDEYADLPVDHMQRAIGLAFHQQRGVDTEFGDGFPHFRVVVEVEGLADVLGDHQLLRRYRHRLRLRRPLLRRYHGGAVS
ncbi:hypothetical protein [Nocardia wallacei]|uniref:hypothetical protein n=1 Tax=Nocardia wallacei TaxID=480035 RepID=UPI002454FA63|nr:hypothetical protein [Nocardia wallacei]